MKKIAIMFDNRTNIVFDDDDRDLSSYALELSEILKYKDVVILETSNGFLILKPSKILSINISEVKYTNTSEEVTEQIEDIITDEAKEK